MSQLDTTCWCDAGFHDNQTSTRSHINITTTATITPSKATLLCQKKLNLITKPNLAFRLYIQCLLLLFTFVSLSTATGVSTNLNKTAAISSLGTTNTGQLIKFPQQQQRQQQQQQQRIVQNQPPSLPLSVSPPSQLAPPQHKEWDVNQWWQDTIEDDIRAAYLSLIIGNSDALTRTEQTEPRNNEALIQQNDDFDGSEKEIINYRTTLPNSQKSLINFVQKDNDAPQQQNYDRDETQENNNETDESADDEDNEDGDGDEEANEESMLVSATESRSLTSILSPISKITDDSEQKRRFKRPTTSYTPRINFPSFKHDYNTEQQNNRYYNQLSSKPHISRTSTLSLESVEPFEMAASQLARKHHSSTDAKSTNWWTKSPLPPWRTQVNHTQTSNKTNRRESNSSETTENAITKGTSNTESKYKPKWTTFSSKSDSGIGSTSNKSNSSPYIPKTDLAVIQRLFHDYFNNVRSHTSRESRQSFFDVKRSLQEKMLDIGLQTGIQRFTASTSQGHIKGHNLIGIYPGKYRNQSRDSVLVIGAHYDTVPGSFGIEDNASGSVAVLELARLLKHCRLNTTVMFVLFDMEEDGLYGSKHFVRDYLFPKEIEEKKVPIKGALIIDMLLEYDASVNSQYTQDLGRLIPEWETQVRANRNRADFAAVWARRSTADTALYKILQRNWQLSSKYKLMLLDPPLPKLGRQLTVGLNSKKLAPYKTFLRSDHSSFWYPHSSKDQTIPALLLTDLGPWRRNVAHRYHSAQDNMKLLTKGNLLFLKNSIDSLLRTVLEIGGGWCTKPQSESKAKKTVR